jgi:hypothetical protein
LTGDLFVQFREYAVFNKKVVYPWDTLYSTLIDIAKGSLYNVIDLAALVVMTVFAFLSPKYLKREYSIYLFLNVIIVLISSNLNGIGRYFLTTFPLFMVLGLLAEKKKKLRWSLYVIYAAFIVLLVIFTMRHVNEGIYLSLNIF